MSHLISSMLPVATHVGGQTAGSQLNLLLSMLAIAVSAVGVLRALLGFRLSSIATSPRSLSPQSDAMIFGITMQIAAGSLMTAALVLS